MKITKTVRLILYVFLLALSFQKAQTMEAELRYKPLHHGVSVISRIDAHSTDDINILQDLCNVVTTGREVMWMIMGESSGSKALITPTKQQIASEKF
ncbi:MAG: hypothetical protein K2W94_08395 [Alphaproteobacteria bacterium]|nr:hypothetical protein [Alphaproteobacteria bacterium]